MRVAVNEDGVNALKKLAETLRDGQQEIRGAAEQLNSAAEGSGLGPHQAAIHSVIQDVMQACASSADPANDLAGKLDTLAGKYQEVIDNNRFGNSGN